MKRILLISIMLMLLCLGFAVCAQAEGDGRIKAKIDRIETYGTTLHVIGWVYDANNTSATVTIHVDFQVVRTANLAKGALNSTCPVAGNHYFDFTYNWTTDGVRVCINALYTDNTGNASIYDNVSVFPYVYSIAFNANGGSGAPATEIKHAGIGVKIPSTKPTKAGHTFKGWSTSSTGSAAYQPGGFYNTDGDKTLYAVWEKNTYTVTYNVNGGEGSIDSQSGLYGDAVTLNSSVPVYEGYDFKGWATSADGAAAYQPGQSVTLTANLNLYAVWEKKTYPVTYDANGGEGAPEDQIKVYGDALTLSETAPTREEYVFLGWARSVSATQAEFQPGDSYEENAGLALFAVWNEARLPGDVNGDKTVNNQDVSLLLRYLANIPVTIEARNADVNGDSVINGKDALRLMKYVAGQDVVLE